MKYYILETEYGTDWVKLSENENSISTVWFNENSIHTKELWEEYQEWVADGGVAEDWNTYTFPQTQTLEFKKDEEQILNESGDGE